MKPYEFARTVLNIAGFPEESDRFDHSFQGFCRFHENSVEVVRGEKGFRISCQIFDSKTFKLTAIETSVNVLTADSAKKLGEALRSVESL